MVNNKPTPATYFADIFSRRAEVENELYATSNPAREAILQADLVSLDEEEKDLVRKFDPQIKCFIYWLPGSEDPESAWIASTFGGGFVFGYFRKGEIYSIPINSFQKALVEGQMQQGGKSEEILPVLNQSPASLP